MKAMGAIAILSLLGCTAQPPQYHAIPSWLIPEKPEVPTVPASELSCLTDDAYTKLVVRYRACWQYARELRALLGPEPAND